MPSIEQFQQVERDFLPLAERAGLPSPDEVSYREDPDEVEFVWHDQKLVVVVELDEYSAAAASDEPL